HGVETAGARKTTDCDSDHTHGDDCAGHGPVKAAGDSPKLGWIDRLDQAASERTNPRPRTPAHTFYLRRQAEDKLRIAYELDPSNYANYNSYHLFLTEPQVGTRPTANADVLALA